MEQKQKIDKKNYRAQATCSAALPPRVMQVISKSCSFVIRRFSFGTYWANPRAAVPRGTIVTFNSGSACSKNQPATAWPDSWYATVRLSILLITWLKNMHQHHPKNFYTLDISHIFLILIHIQLSKYIPCSSSPTHR